MRRQIKLIHGHKLDYALEKCKFDYIYLGAAWPQYMSWSEYEFR